MCMWLSYSGLKYQLWSFYSKNWFIPLFFVIILTCFIESVNTIRCTFNTIFLNLMILLEYYRLSIIKIDPCGINYFHRQGIYRCVTSTLFYAYASVWKSRFVGRDSVSLVWFSFFLFFFPQTGTQFFFLHILILMINCTCYVAFHWRTTWLSSVGVVAHRGPNGAVRDGPACSGTHIQDTAGVLPHGARTTR